MRWNGVSIMQGSSAPFLASLLFLVIFVWALNCDIV